MHTFPRLLLDFGADVLADADDVADASVLIFYAHVYDIAVIGFPVKGDMHLHPASAKFRMKVIGKEHISSPCVSGRVDKGLIFINLF